MSYDDKIAAAADVSADYIRRLIEGEIEATKETLQIARFAAASVGNYTRHLSVKHNHERTVLGFATKLSNDPTALMEYITRAMPDVGFVRALKDPADEKKAD